jgi:hypothetical protein
LDRVDAREGTNAAFDGLGGLSAVFATPATDIAANETHLDTGAAGHALDAELAPDNIVRGLFVGEEGVSFFIELHACGKGGSGEERGKGG